MTFNATARANPLREIALSLLTICALAGTARDARSNCASYDTYLSTLGRIDIGGAGYVLEVRDHLAYCAAYWGGIQIFDVSNPSLPQIIAVLPTPDACEDIALAGNLLAVAVVSGGVQLYEITDPTAPLLLGEWSDGGAVVGVAFAGSHLLATDALDGLEVLDIANPSEPVEVGSLDLPYPVRVEVQGDLACVMDQQDGLYTRHRGSIAAAGAGIDRAHQPRVGPPDRGEPRLLHGLWARPVHCRPHGSDRAGSDRFASSSPVQLSAFGLRASGHRS
ncbi:MAG: hypothetical protein IPK72_21870 [Candidatus Eisenbacteria bacterium]|nr:hypothetical protein [Candidatus Eisenbacteria bacterium]